MNNLKERFENYNVVPDSKVWDSIDSTLRHRNLVRKSLLVAASVGVVAVASFVAYGIMHNDSDKIAANKVEDVAAAASQNTLHEESSAIQVQENVETLLNQGNSSTLQEPQSAVSCNYVSETDNAEIVGAIENAPLSIPADVPQKSVASNVVATNSSSVAEAKAPQSSADAAKPAQGNDAVTTSRPSTRIHKASSDSLVVWIPTAFSPDDPSNDDVRLFRVIPNDQATILNYEIFIYSRSGRLVFHSRDINEGWDGTSRGAAQPLGTYVYVLEINDANLGLQHKRGTITLIR